MSNPLISILIPFYNEENHIKRALLSCVNQTYPNIEIILIDDYSTDNSVKIIKEVKKDYSNIILTKSKTKGVGSARNTGVELIKGNYFAFLDADDELDLNFISTCFGKVQLYNCDVVIANTQPFDINSNPISKFNFSFEDKLLTNQSALINMHHNEIIPSPWGKLFEVSLINQFSFPDGICFDDKPFITHTLLTSNKTCLISEKLYNNYSHDQSITRKTINEKTIQDSITSFFIELKIIDNKAKEEFKYEFIKNAFRYQLQIMTDLFLIINLDRKVINFSEIKSVYHNSFKKISLELINRKIKLPLKSKILQKLIESSKYFGFSSPYFLLKVYKKKHLEFIKKIKG